jgi:hypothetical protein
MILGLVLLAQIGPASSAWDVTRDIVIIGAGLGATFPLTIAVVQAGLPHQLVGVATSQVTFWRSLGGTIGTAILGSILTNRLPGAVRSTVAALPPSPHLGAIERATAGGPQALLDSSRLAQVKASLPLEALPAFDQFVHAGRLALASSLHDLFLISAVVAAVALIASVFLREVPLTRQAVSLEDDMEAAA